MTVYNPPTFLTPELAAEVFAERSWPASYDLEDWRPDGVAMVFPNCALMFVEGFESKVALHFLPENTGLDEPITIADALAALRWAGKLPDAKPPLIADPTPRASAEKVRNELRDLCALVLAYLQPALLGDFSWVETYRAYRARGAG